MSHNEQIRDSAFTLLFRNEKYVVDLYAELTGKRLDPNKIRSVRLDDDVKKSRLYNDVAFLTEDNCLLVLIEHQSTQNASMAFRMLEYYVALAGKLIKSTGENKYGPKQVQIPKAEFYVVYNGKNKMEDLPILDLGDVQVRAKVANIHFGNLSNHDPNNALAAYARFVELATQMSINDALDQVVAEGYLTEFFGRKEYRDMFAEVFSYDNEIREEGFEIGFEKSLLSSISNLMQKMNLSADEAMEILEVPVTERQRFQQLLNQQSN